MNDLDLSMRAVSLKKRAVKMKLDPENAAAIQMGRAGKNEELKVGSESFPPRNAPTIKERPARTEM